MAAFDGQSGGTRCKNVVVWRHCDEKCVNQRERKARTRQENADARQNKTKGCKKRLQRKENRYDANWSRAWDEALRKERKAEQSMEYIDTTQGNK